MGPDGKPWVSITVLMGLASFTFGIPADNAIDWVKQFSDEVRLCQAEAKRHASGLVIATDLPTDIPKLNPNLNGGRGVR